MPMPKAQIIAEIQARYDLPSFCVESLKDYNESQLCLIASILGMAYQSGKTAGLEQASEILRKSFREVHA